MLPLGSMDGMAHLDAQKATRPNIVFILADDMGSSDLGCYGSEIETPNLDTLARNGLQFADFHNSPRCCPSRAALMTGMYSHQAGMGMMTSDYGRYPYPAYKGDLSQGCVIPAIVAGLISDRAGTKVTLEDCVREAAFSSDLSLRSFSLCSASSTGRRSQSNFLRLRDRYGRGPCGSGSQPSCLPLYFGRG